MIIWIKRVIVIIILVTLAETISAEDHWIIYNGTKITIGENFDLVSKKLGKYQKRVFVDRTGDDNNWKDFYRYYYFNYKLMIQVDKTNLVFSINVIVDNQTISDSFGAKTGQTFESIKMKVGPFYKTGDENNILAIKDDKIFGSVRYVYFFENSKKIRAFSLLVEDPPLFKTKLK